MSRALTRSEGSGRARPRHVETRSGFRIWLQYDDGVSGEVDLTDIAGKGVFESWNDPEFFASVRIGPDGSISWSDRLDLCPDAMYLRLTGTSPSELFSDPKGPPEMPELTQF